MQLLKLTIILLFAFCATIANVYSQNYTVSTTTENSYVPLPNPTVILTNWDTSLFIDQDIAVNNFNFANMTFNFNGQYPNGMLMFGAGVLAGGAASDSVDFDFDGFFVDLQSAKSPSNQSAMEYEVDGTAPNRILKFEWKNAKLTYGDTSDYVNFQEWLYEGTSAFEAHFGPSYIKNPAKDFGPGLFGPHIGIFFASTKAADNNKILKSWYLNGDPSKPTVVKQSFSAEINGMPKNGTVYTFSDISSGINNELESPKFSTNIFPNPASSIINIEYANTSFGSFKIDIIDVTGKTVSKIYDGICQPNQSFIFNSSTLSKGVYFIKFTSEQAIETRKLIVE